MEDKTLFIDTNILVYANVDNYMLKQEAVSKLKHYNQQGFDLWISRQVIREYLMAMSKLMILSGNYDENKLIMDVNNFQSQFFVADENVGTTQILLELVKKYKVAGKAIHDCAIVAVSLQHEIRNILTNNISDFVRYKERLTIIPLIDPH